jgi:CoA:oxalate CoA-transferase
MNRNNIGRLEKMPGLLDGIKVLDWGSFANGPLIGAMLGELGADVIKIEEPAKGDAGRGMQAMYGGSMDLAQGRHVLTECTNHNKRSLTLNLKTEEGRQVVYKLVRNSDIFVTNYSRRVARDLGLDYPVLSRLNPGLIYCVASGFGTRGPEADKRAFDTLALARSGLMMAAGEQDGPPMQITGAIADTLGATISTLDILAALAYRERSHAGQEIETSLLDGLIWLQQVAFSTYLLRGREAKRHSRTGAANPLANHYECRDGKWIMLGEPQSDRFWNDFCRVLGLAALEADPRFDNALHRKENQRELISLLDGVFKTDDRDGWVRKFEGANVKFAYAPVNTLAEVVADPQVIANEYIAEYDHPVLGAVKRVAFPGRFSRTPPSIKCPAPEVGQHTEEILQELGYSWEQIVELKDKGAI